MKILINDIADNKEQWLKKFQAFNYERNELIFCHSFEDCKKLFEMYLEKDQGHLDLIITCDQDKRNDILKANSLAFLKQSLHNSYSNRNFRISSIPLILYSHIQNISDIINLKFDAIIKPSSQENHDPYIIGEVENLIRKWRQKLIDDFERIGLNIKKASYFKNRKEYELYQNQYAKNYEGTFVNHTNILSRDFIKSPKILYFDWLIFTQTGLENILLKYRTTYTNHLKYNRKDNERTILHQFFLENPITLKRGVYTDILHERKLVESGLNNRQECDFILKTDLPTHLNTNFFEVKKEDVQLMVNKKGKRPQFSSNYTTHLNQLWDYKEYTQNPSNKNELIEKIGYETRNYTYEILAGRFEEKNEVLERYNKSMTDHYPGLRAYTFEEFEELNYRFTLQFNRLSI